MADSRCRPRKPPRCRGVVYGSGYGGDRCEASGEQLKLVPYEDGTAMFKRSVCGFENHPYEPTKTELLPAACKRCRERFLWKKQHHRSFVDSAPSYCRACMCDSKAIEHAKKHKRAAAKAVELRAQQRSAIAKYVLRHARRSTEAETEGRQ